MAITALFESAMAALWTQLAKSTSSRVGLGLG
jgi:hypothetical protein